MREIKFRAFQKSTQKMLPVNSLKAICINSERLTEEEYDDLIIMQYTGLKDKNWKELYEGDIYDLKTWSKVYYRWYIRILDTYSGFRHKTIKTERVHRYKYWPGWNKFEIIWNIYENPELLN